MLGDVANGIAPVKTFDTLKGQWLLWWYPSMNGIDKIGIKS